MKWEKFDWEHLCYKNKQKDSFIFTIVAYPAKTKGMDEVFYDINIHKIMELQIFFNSDKTLRIQQLAKENNFILSNEDGDLQAAKEGEPIVACSQYYYVRNKNELKTMLDAFFPENSPETPEIEELKNAFFAYGDEQEQWIEREKKNGKVYHDVKDEKEIKRIGLAQKNETVSPSQNVNSFFAPSEENSVSKDSNTSTLSF